MAVSKEDREYFQRIGEAKAKSHAEANGEHLKLSIAERLQRSEEFCQRYRGHKSSDRDDASQFYELARRLGLYLE